MYCQRKVGGFWVCDDEIDLIPQRGSVVFVRSPPWQLIGGQFSVVTPLTLLATSDPPPFPPTTM